MRVLALILILANVAVYFWATFVDVPAPTLVTTALDLPSNNSVPTIQLAKERPVTPMTEPVAVESKCVSVGPFAKEDQTTPFMKRLQAAGLSFVSRTETVEDFTGYWVILDGFASKAAADKALSELHAKGASDAYVLTDEQSSSVLSLGLFSDRARAESRRDAMAKLGVQPTIKERTRKVDKYWLDVTLAAQMQELDPTLLHAEGSDVVRLATKACAAKEPQVVQQSAASSVP